MSQRTVVFVRLYVAKGDHEDARLVITNCSL